MVVRYLRKLIASLNSSDSTYFFLSCLHAPSVNCLAAAFPSMSQVTCKRFHVETLRKKPRKLEHNEAQISSVFCCNIAKRQYSVATEASQISGAVVFRKTGIMSKKSTLILPDLPKQVVPIALIQILCKNAGNSLQNCATVVPSKTVGEGSLPN